MIFIIKNKTYEYNSDALTPIIAPRIKAKNLGVAHRDPGDLASVLGIPATSFRDLEQTRFLLASGPSNTSPPFCLKYYIDPDIYRYTHIYLHILTIEIIKHIHTNNTNLSSSMAPVTPPPAQIILKPIPDIVKDTF